MEITAAQTLEIEVGRADDCLISRDVADALTLIQAGVAKLNHTNLDTHHTHTAIELITEVELIGRQVDVARTKVMDSIDRTGVHAIDGHRTAKAMVSHHAKLSEAAGGARQKNMKMLRALPVVAKRYDDGEISTSVIDRLGRLYSNPRIRDFVVDADGWLAQHALDDTYDFFDTVVSEWEKLADEDGAESKDARHEQNRNHLMYQTEDGSWDWKGSCAAFDGSISSDIFDAFERIEFDIDWNWAVENYGDEANSTHMPRTAAQRRADAFAKIHLYAAKGLAADGGPEIVTDIVIDDETFEREVLKLAGVDPNEVHGPNDPCRDDYECRTLTGKKLSPKTAVSHAMLSNLRRMVVGADSVTTDLGRQRIFTGYARLAAQLNASECYWPGCHVNVSNSQIDHLTPHSMRDGPCGPDPGGGLTNPHNAGVCCGKHNRHKERGYKVFRDETGTITIIRPDGTILR